jgi:ribosome-associated toxin RatA of RatAB toxin-antitoxin module
VTRIQRSALVPCSASKLYGIVDDVPRYPAFLPWCASAEVLEATPTEMVATLEVAGRGVRERFTTRNRRFPHERIELVLVDGPFRSFAGAWVFSPIGGDQGCRVELTLDFELSGATALLGPAFSSVFVRAADRMVDAFCARAQSITP